MRKNFTFKKLAGRLCALAMLLFAAVNSFAGEQLYYYFWAQMETLPTGKGLVYANVDSVEPDYQESQAYMFMSQLYESDPTAAMNVWVKPADGYLFAGWSADGVTLTESTPSLCASWDGNSSFQWSIDAKTEGHAEGIDDPFAILIDVPLHAARDEPGKGIGCRQHDNGRYKHPPPPR